MISLDFIVIVLLSALWVMLPAYVPNPVAAAIGGGAPIDGYAKWKDGKRLFGDGKTWRGLLGGVVAGIVVGFLEIYLSGFAPLSFLPTLTPAVVILLSCGALLGDLVKSFFKRRLGKDRGAEWPVADQYDLVAGSLLLVAVFAPAWTFSTITLPILIAILIITPLLHRAMNIIGYFAGVKDVPW